MKAAVQSSRKEWVLTCSVSNVGRGKGATYTFIYTILDRVKEYTHNIKPKHIQAVDKQSNVLKLGKEIFLKKPF